MGNLYAIWIEIFAFKVRKESDVVGTYQTASRNSDQRDEMFIVEFLFGDQPFQMSRTVIDRLRTYLNRSPRLREFGEQGKILTGTKFPDVFAAAVYDASTTRSYPRSDGPETRMFGVPSIEDLTNNVRVYDNTHAYIPSTSICSLMKNVR
jgi:hypothetical protein